MMSRKEAFNSYSIRGAIQTKKLLSAEALGSQGAFYCRCRV